MKSLFKNSFRLATDSRVYFLLTGVLLILSCKKTNYLDVEASSRPSLTAKISFVNARPVNQGVNFYTYTTQVTPSPVAVNKATPYMDAQFGLVQINITAAGSTSYLASRVFGGAADFSSSGGPNGPIAGYYHTVFALKAKASNFTVDSLMLFYDDLSVPAAGTAKFRFVNIATGSGPVDVLFNGTPVFTSVAYGAAGGAVLSGSGLNAYSIGPFKSITAGSGNLVIRSSTGNGSPVKLNSTEWDNFNFAAGKIYTIFLNGDMNATVGATALMHN